MNHKEITDQQELEEIIKTVDVCHLAMTDGENPYVIPMNFGYSGKTIFIHSGKGGKKSEILAGNPKVCICFNRDPLLHIRHENVACSYSMKFRSVIVTGTARIVEDYEDKVEAMNIIMEHYTGKVFSFNKPAIDNVRIISIEIESMTGRERGYS